MTHLHFCRSQLAGTSLFRQVTHLFVNGSQAHVLCRGEQRSEQSLICVYGHVNICVEEAADMSVLPAAITLWYLVVLLAMSWMMINDK